MIKKAKIDASLRFKEISTENVVLREKREICLSKLLAKHLILDPRQIIKTFLKKTFQIAIPTS